MPVDQPLLIAGASVAAAGFFLPVYEVRNWSTPNDVPLGAIYTGGTAYFSLFTCSVIDLSQQTPVDLGILFNGNSDDIGSITRWLPFVLMIVGVILMFRALV